MGRHRKINVWYHFIPQGADGNVVSVPDAKIAQCVYCEWKNASNVTRMKKHYEDNHVSQEQTDQLAEHVEEHAQPAMAPNPKRQRTLDGFIDRR